MQTGKQLSGVHISSSSLSVFAGTTSQLSATASYSDGTTVDVTTTATWTSSNPQVATVTAGLVTASASGSAVISASYLSDSATSSLTVGAALKGLLVEPADLFVLVGQTAQLVSTAVGADGTTMDVSAQTVWSSGNSSAITVSATGLASAVAAGATKISGTYQGVSNTIAITGATSPPSTGTTLFDNATDSHLLERQPAPGFVVDYWGAKDTTGLTQSILYAAVTGPDNKTLQYTFDAQNHPLTAYSPSGFSMTFSWDGNNVTTQATTPSGASAKLIRKLEGVSGKKLGFAGNASFDRGYQRAWEVPKISRDISLKPRDGSVAQCSSSVLPNVSEVSVAGCGQPATSATVQVVVNGFVGLGGTFPALPVGGGLYDAALPTADPNAGEMVTQKCDSIVAPLETASQSVCDFIGLLLPPIDKIADAVCAPLLAPVFAELGPEAFQSSLEECAALLEGAGHLCDAADQICNSIGDTVDIYQKLTGNLSLNAISTVPGIGAQGAGPAPAQSIGPYPCFSIDYGSSSNTCSESVEVFPGNPTLGFELQAATLGASAPILFSFSRPPCVCVLELCGNPIRRTRPLIAALSASQRTQRGKFRSISHGRDATRKHCSRKHKCYRRCRTAGA